MGYPFLYSLLSMWHSTAFMIQYGESISKAEHLLTMAQKEYPEKSIFWENSIPQ